MNKLLISCVLFFLSLNINAEISQYGITDIRQLDDNEIIELISGNQLTGFISDGPYEGPIIRTFYKDGTYETTFEDKIYSGIWQVGNTRLCAKLHTASDFNCIYWYIGSKDGGTYAYIVNEGGQIVQQYHESISLVQLNQEKKKAEETNSTLVSASDRQQILDEISYLINNTQFYNYHLYEQPNSHLQFENKEIVMEGNRFSDKGKDCGNSIITVVLKPNGEAETTYSSKNCDFRKAQEGAWQSQKNKLFVGNFSKQRSGATALIINKFEYDFLNKRVFHEIHYLLEGNRGEQSGEYSNIATYKNLKDGNALPLGREEIEAVLYASSLVENAETKTALFGVRLLESPEKYDVKNKRSSKEPRPIVGPTLTELLKANYGANLEFYFYDLEPPVKNNSFGEYKIRTVAVNGVEVVSNVNARAKCPFKGINGCKEISEAIDAALEEKYGLVADEPADFQDENGNIYTVMLSLVLTVDGEFASGYDLIENANGLFLSLGINWSEQSLMNKFSIDPDSKKNVDTNF